MGLVHADIILSNPRQPDLNPLGVRALFDTDAMTICIPEHVAVQLQLEEIEKREVTIADVRPHVVPNVGPIQIRFKNRTCFTGALVIGESVLLGAVPMEDMDLVIEPSRQTIEVNPKSPNIPSAVVKQVDETEYLLSIPGMKESILEGKKTPVSECSRELDEK